MKSKLHEFSHANVQSNERSTLREKQASSGVGRDTIRGDIVALLESCGP